MNPNVQVLLGDCRAVLPTLASESVQCCVTSPPYWGLRKYLFADAAAEIGQEKTPSEYVAALVAVFQEVHRVLRKDGTLFLNLGDTYAGEATEAAVHSPKMEFAARSQAPIKTKPRDSGLVGQLMV